MTTKEEIVSMKKDISSINEKIDSLDDKLDMLTERLLNPDTGVTARVNRNTAMRNYRLFSSIIHKNIKNKIK